MENNILIISMLYDIHGYAVNEGLSKKGIQSTLLISSDFPSKMHHSMMLGGETNLISAGGLGPQFDNPKFDVVWNRRPACVIPRDQLHPADYKYAELVANSFQESFFKLLGSNSFWVNPPKSGGTKITQQAAAIECELKTPESLYTNDPDLLRKFLAEHDGKILHKPMRGQTWRKENSNTIWIPYSSIISLNDLPDDDIIELCPGIYQEIVEKAFELRVTIFGNQVFTAKIDSQATKAGKTDWRLANEELKFEPYTLPNEIKLKCFMLMRKLGVVFGAIDFIVTPNGEYVFLEINQAGQFLFIEEDTGYPLLDAFCDFLISKDPDFVYTESKFNKVNYLDMRDRLMKKMTSENDLHTYIPNDASVE